MERLPNEVLIDILSRLRVRHLCQLKSVSRQWNNLISDPHFKKSHLTRSMRTPRLLVVQESTQGHPALFGQPLSRTLYISTVDISTGEICQEFTKDIVGRHYSLLSCNNLICIEKFMAVAVCNPTTHEMVHLPLPSQPSIRHDLVYHLARNEYKIVHSFRHPEQDTVGFEIVTLKDCGPVPKSWRKLESHSSVTWYPDDSLIDYLSMDGAIYWLIGARQGTGKGIFMLEMETEQLRSIHYPQDQSENGCENEQLVEIRSSLCLAYCSEKSSTISILLLKDQADQTWEKGNVIELNNVNFGLKIVGYVPGDDQNGEILLRTTTEKPFLYKIKNRSFGTSGKTDTRIGWHKNLYFDRFFNLGRR